MVALPSVDFGCVPPTALDEPPVFLVFGGIHTMYCTNDIWQLRPRRRRSRFYSTMQKHVDAVVGASTTTGRLDTVVKVGALDDAHSGSDDEDWIVADDTAGEAEAEGIVAPVDGAEGETTLTTTVVPFRGGDGTRGSATRLLGDGDALVQELHTELLKVKKALIRSQESHAVEVTRRQRCEDELDDLRAQLAAASAQLAEQQTAFAAEKAVLLEEVYPVCMMMMCGSL